MECEVGVYIATWRGLGKLASHVHMFTDARFVARVVSLHDIYLVLADGSRALQNVQKLPWEGMADFGGTIMRLRNMADVLEEVMLLEVRELSDMDGHWPTLSSHPLDKVMVRFTIFNFTSAYVLTFRYYCCRQY